MPKKAETLIKIFLNKKLFEEELLPENIYLQVEKSLLKEAKTNEFLSS
ncbi:MAG: hypothetical protein Q4F33_00215 [Mycoplasmatota bacterium]|nr:hypothetical protein [Mycoplasmatota bacterium]